MLSFNRLRRARRSAEESEPRTLRERGAAALEFALIAPFFFLVVFGGIEIGFMFRSNLALQDTSRTAARVASVERNGEEADLRILEKINSRVGSLNGDIMRVVIFSGDTLNAEVPVPCTTTTSPALPGQKCNVYMVHENGQTLQEVIDAWTPFTTGNPPGIIPADRSSSSNIGVYIAYDYDYVTGFFDTITLSSTTVEAIELDL